MTQFEDQQAFDVSFQVPSVHRLRFTSDVLGDDHRALLNVLEPSEAGKAKVQFWIDEDVALANPRIETRLKAFVDAHSDRLTRVGPVQKVPGGEAIKNDIHILERMLKVFNAADLDRRSYVVVVGGGAVLDAVGFAAAIAHRGLRLVRLPTTTLAQADSGVGVKNGVNLFGKKNWIGTFAVPWAVINDYRLLETLSDRDFVCGFSEAVKVALLKDAALFDELCAQASSIPQRDPNVVSPLIRKSALWHLKHITTGGDPFEALEARPLDFGHWSAHKLEPMSEFQVRHGEAVAIGVAIDTVYSSLVLGLSPVVAKRVLKCLKSLGFSLSSPFLADTMTLFAGLEEFRQHLGGRLTLTMLRDVADPIEVHEVDQDKMCAAIEQVRHFSDSTTAISDR